MSLEGGRQRGRGGREEGGRERGGREGRGGRGGMTVIHTLMIPQYLNNNLM